MGNDAGRAGSGMIAPGRLRRVAAGPILGGLTLGSPICDGFKIKTRDGRPKFINFTPKDKEVNHS